MAALADKTLFLLDLDGTLYLDEQLFDGAREFLATLRAQGRRYLFLTNNSSRGAQTYVQKLARLGVARTQADFLTAVDATIADLRRTQPGALLYVFGTASFREQLAAAGLRVTDRLQNGIGALVVGFDTELTFQKLEDACILLGQGVDFIATNPDWVCPTWYGFVPDCGSVCEMLTRATGRRARFIGKPEPAMVQLALQRTRTPPEQAVLIGDRLYTDIACGENAGIDTILVLSGETTQSMLQQSKQHPTWVLKNIRQVLSYLQEERTP